MCKFGTHTLAVSMSFAEIDGHSLIAPPQRGMVRWMKRIGQCYICGGPGPRYPQSGHSRLSFVELRPKNPLTFPAHRACKCALQPPR